MKTASCGRFFASSRLTLFLCHISGCGNSSKKYRADDLKRRPSGRFNLGKTVASGAMTGVPPLPPTSESLNWRGVCKKCPQNLEPQGVRGQNLETKGLIASVWTLVYTASALSMICSLDFEVKVGCHMGLWKSSDFGVSRWTGKFKSPTSRKGREKWGTRRQGWGTHLVCERKIQAGRQHQVVLLGAGWGGGDVDVAELVLPAKPLADFGDGAEIEGSAVLACVLQIGEEI
jgi:hypothetical protein